MNKGRRQELTQLKFKKRIGQVGLKESYGKMHMYKSHGTPCSCFFCRGLKYRDVDRQKAKVFEVEH